VRFIGNKESITSEIYALLQDKGLTGKGLTFFDAFCGSGAVADAMKGDFNIIINDILKWCVVYTNGRMQAASCDFNRLGFDPFHYFNNNSKTVHGFIYNNYSPGGSNRMYFTKENAARIDYFRQQIQIWRDAELIEEIEYQYLLACLIESVSGVSNTAGVYGAFLKKWDPRAVKPIIFTKVDSRPLAHNGAAIFNNRVEDIIENIDCDVLYLDPPYTQNQYGTQYHLLETLVLDDSPTLSKITGSRPVTPMRSDWSKEYKANILFDKIISKTKARYIIFSYNNDGFMSKDFIESSLKRYGKPDTFVCKNIAYKKYRNWKTKSNKDHYEYLFFIEKKPMSEVVYECPLNYVGSKAKMIKEIRHLMPQQTATIIDAFGGGFNVGVNLKSKRVAYNDLNFFVTQLVKSFRDLDTYEYLRHIRTLTKKFNLEKENSQSYNAARDYYNSQPKEKRDPRLLFTLILYGFQQQIRFNSNYGFNNPAGNRWFNDKVLEKMISFSRRIKELDIDFTSYDFRDFPLDFDEDTFVYLDPPYRLTCGTYNDGKRGFEGWTKEHEIELFKVLDDLDSKDISFMLSYIIENGEHKNEQLLEWLNKRDNYSVIEIKTGQGRYKNRKEVLIINYGQAPFHNQEQISKEI